MILNDLSLLLVLGMKGLYISFMKNEEFTCVMKNASPSYTSSLDSVFSLGVAGIGGNGERLSNVLKKKHACLLAKDYT